MNEEGDSLFKALKGSNTCELLVFQVHESGAMQIRLMLVNGKKST